MAMEYSSASILELPDVEEEIVANPMISVAEYSENYGRFVAAIWIENL